MLWVCVIFFSLICVKYWTVGILKKNKKNCTSCFNVGDFPLTEQIFGSLEDIFYCLFYFWNFTKAFNNGLVWVYSNSGLLIIYLFFKNDWFIEWILLYLQFGFSIPQYYFNINRVMFKSLFFLFFSNAFETEPNPQRLCLLLAAVKNVKVLGSPAKTERVDSCYTGKCSETSRFWEV